MPAHSIGGTVAVEGLVAGLLMAALSGCQTVSLKEVLGTSYGAGRELVVDASPAPAADAGASERARSITVQTTEQSLPVGMTSASAMTGLVASGNQALTSNQQRFLSSTNNQISAMNARLLELRAQARIKGVAAEAAMRRHVRDYDLTLKLLEDQMIGARTLDSVGWADLEATTVAHLRDARIALENAIAVVEALPNTRS